MTNIVIVGRGRRKLTAQTLDSLYGNTVSKDFNCVFVSDDEDDFRIRNMLRQFQKSKNFSLLEVANSGHVLSQLKNLGVAWSEQRFGRGDWLYLSDADVLFMPNWLDKLTAFAMETEPLSFRLWGGQIHPFHKSAGLVGNALDMKYPGVPYYDVLDGPSWLMRWETWRQVGPLDRNCAAGPCQSEEYPWCEKIRAQSGRIGVISPHCMVHTGLSQTDGKPAPGAAERRFMIPAGVLSE